MRAYLLIPISALLGFMACDDAATESTDPMDLSITDVMPGQDQAVERDIDAATIGDAGTGNDGSLRDLGADLGPDTSRVNVPPSTPRLLAGTAERSLGFPIGIGTVGYAPGAGAKTPFALTYPGTNAQHTDLTARALVLRQDGIAIALVRSDSVGIWQDMVRDVQVRLRDEGRGDLADGLVIGATHTHSSGGRIFDHFIGALAVGPFLPGLYQRVRDAIVESVLLADEAAVPAKVGHMTIEVPRLHTDRRCENPTLQDDSMGLIKVEHDNGDLLALVVNYAIHGTVLGTDDWTLSRDASGAIEAGIEAALPRYAPVLFFQSWAGDMAPEAPSDRVTNAGHDLRPAFIQLDAIAAEAAAVVPPRLTEIETTTTPGLKVASVAVPLDVQLINPNGQFDNYEYGGIYCLSAEANCLDSGQPFGPEDLSCLPVPADWTVNWTLMSAIRIGDLGLVTLPGEPLTSVGTQLRDQALMSSGLSQMFVLGYAQGYLAYLLHPEDYWMGGYESASSLMGPGFGRYLIERGTSIAGLLADEATDLDFTPIHLGSHAALEYEPLVDEAALGEPAVETQSPEGADQVWIEWVGGGPLTDAPRVHLQAEVEENWVDVVHPSGQAITSGGPEIELSLAVEPSYEAQLEYSERVFRWTARMPRIFSVTPPGGQLTGTYRFVIEGVSGEAYRLVGAPFTLATP